MLINVKFYTINTSFEILLLHLQNEISDFILLNTNIIYLMRKFIFLISAVCLLSMAFSCSDDKSEPVEPAVDSTTQTDRPGSEDTQTGEAEEFPKLSMEEFNELVVGKYWWNENSTLYHKDGTVGSNDDVVGYYENLAFLLSEDGVMREYNGFMLVYYESMGVTYNPETGFMTSPTSRESPYQILKVEDNKLYIKYRFHKSIINPDTREFEEGSYTIAEYKLAAPYQISQLEQYDKW